MRRKSATLVCVLFLAGHVVESVDAPTSALYNVKAPDERSCSKCKRPATNRPQRNVILVIKLAESTTSQVQSSAVFLSSPCRAHAR